MLKRSVSNISKVLILTGDSQAYSRRLLQGIAKYNHMHEPWIFYVGDQSLETVLPHLRKWQVSGIIAHMPCAKTAKLIPSNIPCIAIHNRDLITDFPTIVVDSQQIGKLAAEHFLSSGFHNFAFCGFRDTSWSDSRRNSFVEFITEKKFQVATYTEHRKRSEPWWKNTFGHLTEWLEQLPKPVGIFACNDDCGRDISQACKLVGINIPEQVALIGVDNDELVCEFCYPSLSSIHLDAEKAGFEAAELLDSLMTGKKTKQSLIVVNATHLVQRRSTDALVFNQSGVANAIKFIRMNAREAIQVQDVAEIAAMSRRNIQRVFRKAIGRSVNEEIRHTRVVLIAEMLIKTNMSILRIASKFQGLSMAHIARYFRQEKGMSLREYRKKFGQP